MRQQEIPGTADPDAPTPPPELLAELDEFLGQEETLSAERERIKDLRDTLVANMVARGYAKLPYVDANTGKRKFFVADTTARAKKISAAGSDGKAKKARERDVEIAEGVPPDETVEKRRVRRTKAHDDMADPFGATRVGLVEEAERKTEH